MKHTQAADRASRAAIPLPCADLSALAKSLRAQLSEHHAREGQPPGHQALLNMLARAAGFRNLQALKAAQQPGRAALPAEHAVLTLPEVPEALPTEPAPALPPTALKLMACFDPWGRLTRMPSKYSAQVLAMWALWTRFERGQRYTEAQVNTLLRAWTVFGDPVTPRRELINLGLLARTDDCRAYWRLDAQPTEDIRQFLRALRLNQRAQVVESPRKSAA
ncbi:DUF2087 domain-containing protein [Roseateles sp. BYS180W]|uniref:DUF2087 domain-containing protein n=1 Tax=Roseateles rivi TaxID=3299028 RepID=A0ABW7FUF4_9BURK